MFKNYFKTGFRNLLRQKVSSIINIGGLTVGMAVAMLIGLLVVLSLFVAFPIAWYAMQNWLQDYQYRTELSWTIFAGAGIGSLLITLLTVSFQAIKAALSNPVKALRSE